MVDVAERDRNRPEYHKWYKTYRWQKTRLAQIRAKPFCEKCLPRVVPAKICDHVEPHKGDEQKFWNGPFQSLCKPCHDGLKQREEKGSLRRPIGKDGWPE